MLLNIIDIIFRGFTVGIASSITVGPVAVICIQRTLSKNPRSGLVSGVGVACADSIMATVAFFFYSMLQSQIEQYNLILRIAGGIFVVVVGVAIFFQNPLPQIRRNRAGKSTPWQDFASMFGLTIANFVIVIPYILAFFAMFGVSTDSGGADIESLASSALIIAGFFCGALTWWVLLTAAVSLFRHKFRPRHILTLNHICGVVVTVLGIITIFSSFR